MYVWVCVTSSDANTMQHLCGQYSVTNCQCDVSAFDLRRSMCQPSKIDVLTFEDRYVDLRRSMCRPSKTDDRLSTFEDRCVDLRRSMCRPSKIDDRCVNLQRSMIDVSTLED